MSESEQSALIAQARDGSVAAFSALVGLHQDRLFRFLLSRSNSRVDAEDAMQEAFINAYRYMHSYDSRWQFSTWLYKIALRELGRIASRTPADSALQETEHGHVEGPLAACIADDSRQNLWLQARSILGDDAFTVLWLRYAEDMPVKDVARVMVRPVTWVKVVAHRARKSLRNGLAGIEHAGWPPSGAETVEQSTKESHELSVSLQVVKSDGS